MFQMSLLFALAGLSSVMDASPLHGANHAHARAHQSRAVAGKRGVAFPKVYNGSPGSAYTKLFEGSPQVSWKYDWEAVIDGTPDTNLNYVPLLHSNEAWCEDGWFANVAASRKTYNVTHVLSFNEPDQTGGGGSGMAVGDCITAHKKYLQPLAAQGLRIGSPSVTNGVGANTGIGYLQQFMDGCSGCQIDFVVAHYYAWDNFDDFKNYLTKFHTTFNKPVWLTEFAINPGQGDTVAFLNKALPWMDQQLWIERYAYHMAAPDVEGKSYLVNAAGNGLTTIGQTYATCASS